MNMRNWRPEAQLAAVIGFVWLGSAGILVASIAEAARRGYWVLFAGYLVWAVLITGAFMLTLWNAARQHARSRQQERQ